MKVAVIALIALLGLSVAYTLAEEITAEDVNAAVTRKLIELICFIYILQLCVYCVERF